MDESMMQIRKERRKRLTYGDQEANKKDLNYQAHFNLKKQLYYQNKNLDQLKLYNTAELTSSNKTLD